jgi:hypothetical protein
MAATSQIRFNIMITIYLPFLELKNYWFALKQVTCILYGRINGKEPDNRSNMENKNCKTSRTFNTANIPKGQNKHVETVIAHDIHTESDRRN